MSKYIKIFETVSAFQSAQATLDLPNVSLTIDNNIVHYLPYVTPFHDYVEIGGIKWATMNLGANSITDTGLYYQWGDTQGYSASQVGNGEGQKYFGWTDYKYCDGTNNPKSENMIKYNYEDDLLTLLPEDDAVTAAWGGNWRMPTKSEWQILDEAVTKLWTNDYEGSGVAGAILTDKTDISKVLFLPITNSYYNGKPGYFPNNCYYWSSTRFTNTNNCLNGTCILYGQNNKDLNVMGIRYIGYVIRGILDE